MAAEPVDPRTAREMQRAGDTVIDVRTPEEFAHEHVAGAINIPIETLLTAELPDGQLITTCSMGGRARKAADLLDGIGRSAFLIEGGTKVWRAAGFPVTGRMPS